MRRKTILTSAFLALFALGAASCAPSRGDAPIVRSQTGTHVNAYLWRASLETLSFMPVKNLDPFSGVLITEWRAAPQAPSERFRMTAYILGARLSAETLRVRVYRQTRRGTAWEDADVSPEVALAIENLILSRARSLHLAARTPL